MCRKFSLSNADVAFLFFSLTLALLLYTTHARIAQWISRAITRTCVLNSHHWRVQLMHRRTTRAACRSSAASRGTRRCTARPAWGRWAGPVRPPPPAARRPRALRAPKVPVCTFLLSTSTLVNSKADREIVKVRLRLTPDWLIELNWLIVPVVRRTPRSPAKVALAEGVGRDRELEAEDSAPPPPHPHPVQSSRMGARGNQKQRRELAPAAAAPGHAVAKSTSTASSIGQLNEVRASTGATDLTVRACSVLIAVINDYIIIIIRITYH